MVSDFFWHIQGEELVQQQQQQSAVSFQKITKWATQVTIKYRSDRDWCGNEQLNETSHQLYWKVLHYSPVPYYFSVYIP